MQELIFRFTPDELNVLQQVLQIVDRDVPIEWEDQDAYDSLYNKVMSN